MYTENSLLTKLGVSLDEQQQLFDGHRVFHQIKNQPIDEIDEIGLLDSLECILESEDWRTSAGYQYIHQSLGIDEEAMTQLLSELTQDEEDEKLWELIKKVKASLGVSTRDVYR